MAVIEGPNAHRFPPCMTYGDSSVSGTCGEGWPAAERAPGHPPPDPLSRAQGSPVLFVQPKLCWSPLLRLCPSESEASRCWGFRPFFSVFGGSSVAEFPVGLRVDLLRPRSQSYTFKTADQRN